MTVAHPTKALNYDRPNPLRRPMDGWSIGGAACQLAAFTRQGGYLEAIAQSQRALRAGLHRAPSPLVLQLGQSVEKLAHWAAITAATDASHPDAEEIAPVVDLWDAVWACFWRPDEDEAAFGGAYLRLAMEWSELIWTNLVNQEPWRPALKAFQDAHRKMSKRVRRIQDSVR